MGDVSRSRSHSRGSSIRKVLGSPDQISKREGVVFRDIDWL